MRRLLLALCLLLLGVAAAAQDFIRSFPIPIGTTSGEAFSFVYVKRAMQGSVAKALTDAAAATAFATVAVPTNGWAGGELIWTATSLSGADRLTTQGNQLAEAYNKMVEAIQKKEQTIKKEKEPDAHSDNVSKPEL